MPRKLTPKELKTWRSYYVPGCGSHTTRKVNAIFIHIVNTKAHELAKSDKAYDLIQSGSKIITEAVRNRPDSKGVNRRVDLIDITTGVEYEFETTLKRALRFLDDSSVVVIPVNWPEKDIKKWADMALEKE